MTEFDINPIEELGLAMNTLARVIGYLPKELLSEERIMLRLAYQGIHGVQQMLFDNEW